MANRLAIVFRSVQGKFRPSMKSRFARETEYARDLNHYSLVVGLTAIALPVVLATASVLEGDRYDSISHYYFSRYLGGVFVISLAFIAATMFAFKGETKLEGRLAKLASIAVILTAFVPTSGPGSDAYPRAGRAFVEIVEDREVRPAGRSLPPGKDKWREGCAPGDLYKGGACAFVDPFEAAGEGETTGLNRHFLFYEPAPWLEYVHFASAAVVFILLFIFCVFVFARVDDWHLKSGSVLENNLIDGEIGDAKALRNLIYYTCGGIIFVCLASLGWNAFFNESKEWWNDRNLTFWFEAIGLIAFGVAWCVRGRIAPGLFDDEAERARLQALVNPISTAPAS